MTRFISLTLALLLHNASGLAPNYSADRVRASQEVRAGSPPKILDELATSPNIARLMRVFPSNSWTALFPNANKDGGPNGTPYNYLNLVSAVWKFPRFCDEPGQTDAECLHELVVMFSHFIQETGGKRGASEGLEDGLYWQREMNCYNPDHPHRAGSSCVSRYCKEDGVWSVYPCGDRAYYGRGAKQLSWNYNYAAFSKKMTGSANTYLLEPDRIITDGWPALASAIWFWMTPQMPKPSMHEVVTGLWSPNAADTAANIIAGFGTTTNIINGAIECGKGSETAQSVSRTGYYRSLCSRLGAVCFNTPDTCGSMQKFPDGGAAGNGPLYYLDRRWDGVQGCKHVKYQMPFLVGLDEQACKCHYFPNNDECGATTATTTTPQADTTSTTTTTTTATTTTTTTAAATTTTTTSTTAATTTTTQADTTATTTSTVATTTTTQTVATSSASAGCASEWGECGGEGRPSRCCAADTQCYRRSKWYSQCRKSCPAGWECSGGRRHLRGPTQ